MSDTKEVKQHLVDTLPGDNGATDGLAATLKNPRQMGEHSTDFKNSKGNWFRKKGSTKDVLPVLLRLFLFSSLKWKEKRCWISGIHLFLLCLHVTKIAVMTVLTFQVGTCRTTVYMTVYEGYNALRHSLLLHWDAIYETLPYPPSPGAFATYTQPDFQERVNYAVQQYFNLESDAMAYFLRLPGDNITINVIYFDLIRADSEIVDLNSYEEHSFEPQLDVGLEKHTYENGEIKYTYNITKDLEQINLTTVLNRTLALDISFSLHSLRVQKKQNDARCLQIFGTISFDDNDHNGEVEVELNTNTIPIHCSKMKYQLKDSPQCRHYNDDLARATRALVYVTLIVDSFMFLAGVMTLYITFVYKKTNSENPRFREYFWRVQWWNCLSVIGDGFALGGLNGLITNTEEDIYIYKPLKDWDRSMINLGLGCLFTWFSFLRYIRISHKFSLLFKTIRKAALDVLFFMVCVIIIFVGFWASTYVVLGPYHVKFKTKHSTAETLFSIINGDEIYATFAILQDQYAGDQSGIRLFSRMIVYVYVSLFTVLVFNLLIALFNSAYEVVKGQYEDANKKEQTEKRKTLSHYMLEAFNSGNNCHIVNCCFCKIDIASDESNEPKNGQANTTVQSDESNGPTNAKTCGIGLKG